MGVTIHYRGGIADWERLEEFEDRVVDMALEIGASVHIWRRSLGDVRTRVVRGLVLDLAPGQDTTSLLVSPEGWLVPLSQIQAIEKGTLSEPPSCSVDTRFGPVEGHVALAELLNFMKQEFFPDLEVRDESGYWDDRDVQALVGKFTQARAVVGSLAEGLLFSACSGQSVEDAQMIAAYAQRLARQVRDVLARPPEHAPVHWDDGLDWDAVDEAQWDESYKEQRRKQERLHRAMEEELVRGADHHAAFDSAMRSEGIIDLPGESDDTDLAHELADWDDEPEDEPWRESLPPELREDDYDDDFDDDDYDDDDDSDPFSRERHPLQQAASDFYLRLHRLFENMEDRTCSHIDTLMYSTGEICGGLAQALGERETGLSGLSRGLALVQLKRAGQGAAFAKGALVPLRAAGLLTDGDFEELRTTLKELESRILGELDRVREDRSSR